MHIPRELAARAHGRSALALCCLLTLALGACARAEVKATRYDLKGKVVSVDRTKGEVVVDHEEIPGYMAAMQMPFRLRDRDALAAVGAGDTIQATLVVSDEGYWLESPAITKGLPGGAAPTAEAAGPQPGAAVPDVKLVNQAGKPFGLAGLGRDRALLLTFIYTRCPVPDYCPLMSTNFAAVHRELERDETLRGKAHLLSVTLDPAYDTPKVLRSYGAAYTERYGAETFGHWTFATGDPAEIRRLAEFFGLAYKEESGQIVHSLRTALVAPGGKLHKLYRGNEWKPEQVVEDLRALAAPAGP